MHNLTTDPIKLIRIAIALCILFVAALTAQARDINVEGDCSLHDAIIAANENEKEGGCVAGDGPGDVIILKTHLNPYRALPAIESEITIEGSGWQLWFRRLPAFVVDDGSLTLANLHVRFRSPTTDVIMEVDDSKLTLANTVFHDCPYSSFAVENSTIQFLGPNDVCGHAREIVQAWFGVPPALQAVPATCENLTNATVSATQGLASGVQCQEVGPAAIGDQSVIAGGFLGAVDVWGILGPGVQVCFPQVGATIFLDAATAPRAVSHHESYSLNGMTCASLNRAGTLVLVPGEPSGVAPPAAVAEPAPAPAVSEPIDVDGCPIKTTGHINFRAEPSLDAEKLGVVLRGSTVGAVSRIRGWYQINFRGRVGWIGGKYVDNIGNC